MLIEKIYLIRATFLYGNYDDNDRLPEFDVFVGVNRWASLSFDNASHVVNKEIIHVPPLDRIYICLVNTGLGTPFISALEVRHFHNSTYTSVSGAPLVLYERLDFGSATGEIIRYNDDAYDRMWYPYNCYSCGTINTTLTIDSVNRTDFNLPSKVMKTATRPTDENKPLSFELNTREATLDFYIYMHFAELEALQEGESRVFDISLNGIVLRRNVVPSYLHSTTITSPQSVRGSKLNFLLSKSMNSTHPPILNALEVFVIRPFWQSPTDQADGECFMVQCLHGNPKLCTQSPCKKKKSSIFVPVIATIVPLFVTTLAFLILWKYKRSTKGKRIGKSHGALGSGMKLESREFTYQEIIRITDNFRTIIGKGGFGVVYHGHLDDGTRTEVAIKLLSPSATHGSIQFQTEAQLLTRIHHKNLASFVGYCNDGTNVAILYEYMAGGDLEKYISGLEYLHIGCKPPIVHRDVKTSNILLNDKMQAKIADFGLSKLFPVESQSYLSTRVVGTVGYLDPEYYTSNRLTEKSDVYSFGIVLLQLITGRPAIIIGHNENTHIGNWARPLIAKGDLRNLVDPRLLGNFDTNSAWKLLEVSISCIRSISIQRPMMNHVVSELKECLHAEVANEESARVNEDGEVEEEFNNDSFAMSSSTKGVELEQGPEAR
ncbi:unnamed protein product [Linum tenue]|uniref:Protein kinase domain-containing protein n=1 Tax=Linum tenue TaxID=586396 RepID=A0AAV0Q5A4_9ROSI|nr:unnamed protein product [Linum tenue]